MNDTKNLTEQPAAVEENALVQPAVSMSEQFQQWIRDQDHEGYELNTDNPKQYLMQNSYGSAEIGFYDLDIIEIIIRQSTDNSVKYYLHFQLQDLEYAQSLYYEMREAFLDLKNHEKIRVLLCCTSGATTGFLANLLNETASSMSMDYEFDATGYHFLYERALLYDVILAAPQINYQLKKIRSSLPKKLVLQMPTAMFAQNDAFGMLNFVNQELEAFRERKERILKEAKEQEKCTCETCKENKLIVTMGSFLGSVHYHTFGRVYANDQLLFEEQQVKPARYTIGITDMLDTLYARIKNELTVDGKVPEVETIVLALPGLARDGIWDLPDIGINRQRLKVQLEKRYGTQVLIENSANASALGFSAMHPEYESVVFHSQGFGQAIGGQGIVVNNKMISGFRGRAGEVRLFTDRMQYSESPKSLCKTESGMLELVSQSLLCTTALLDPQVIAIRSPLTNDMNEIRERLARFLKPEEIPELVYIPDMQDVMLEGCRQLALQERTKDHPEKESEPKEQISALP